MTERDVQNEIRLAMGRIDDLVLIRNTVGVYREIDPRTGRERVITYGLGKGSADLVGCLAGRFVGLEVKSADGRLTDDQERWAQMIRRHHGFVATVRSADDARAAIERARTGTVML